jgi:predicted dehydrogenase
MALEFLVTAVDRDTLPYQPVRVAVVGLGYWGPNLARVLHDYAGADLFAVCDRRNDALARTARRYPSVKVTTSFADVLAADEIEAVAIATPVSTHHALASAALAAGKHVFVEKPVAASVSEARQLEQAAAAFGRVLMPGHTFLYSPPVNCIRDLLRTGDLGEIYFISMSRVNLGLHQSDASVTWDLAPHDFSILRYWLDETPRYVSATSRSCVFPAVPDVAFITLEFESGIIAHVELAWLAPSKLRRTSVVGSQKMLVYDDTSNEPVRVFDSGVNVRDPQTFGEYNLTYRSGDIISPHVETAEPLQLEMADFCNAIRLGLQPRSTPTLGTDVVGMIEAVDASLAGDGMRIDTKRMARQRLSRRGDRAPLAATRRSSQLSGGPDR